MECNFYQIALTTYAISGLLAAVVVVCAVIAGNK